ncbi:MAG: NAD-dependent epimerase/dehydratase family protein, partial [Desulfamplus sp.]|nr:NAD-dependent epimerase/dehydratase family protein [Desulfamplus sp.]
MVKIVKQDDPKTDNRIGKEKILVTGGGGFLGKAIITQLVRRGDDVSSFSRQLYPALGEMGVKQFQGNISDFHAVEQASIGMDMIFHVAAKAGVSGRWAEYFESNVTGTKNVVNACLKNGVGRLVHTSSPSVIFNGKDMEGVDESVPYPEVYHAPYPETKAMAEKIVLNSTSEALKTIILRPHLIWGPGDNHLLPGMIARYRRLKRVGNGKNIVDTIYIDNAAYAHILAGDKLKINYNQNFASDKVNSDNTPNISESKLNVYDKSKTEISISSRISLSGRVYFISQDEPVPLWKMVDDMLDAAGLPPVKGEISAKTAERAGLVMEKIFSLFNIKKDPPMTRFMAKELATSHWFDISRAKQDLGYKPLISTSEGLLRLKNWLRS